MEPEADTPLDRALAVLNCVASQLKAVSIAEIAAILRLPQPSVHRIVNNLQARHLLQKAPGTKRYVVGNGLVSLAGRTIESAFRSVRRHVVLQAVADEIGEQCEIGVVRDHRVLYLNTVRAAEPQRLQFDAGSSAPLHCTSTGKIYMSMLPPRERDKLVRSLDLKAYTPTTCTDPNRLIDILKDVRRTGWAKSNEEYVAGVVGCAVPILSDSGSLIACLGVSVPAARTRFVDLDRFHDPLVRAAKLLWETMIVGHSR